MACINYDSVNELYFKSVKISNTLLSSRDELHTQCRLSLRLFSNGYHFRGNMESDSTVLLKLNHIQLIDKYVSNLKNLFRHVTSLEQAKV